MPIYEYKNFRERLFTDKGQREVMAVRDHIRRTCKISGCIEMWKALAPVSGDTWENMAIIDRLAELGEVKKIVFEGLTILLWKGGE